MDLIIEFEDFKAQSQYNKHFLSNVLNKFLCSVAILK